MKKTTSTYFITRKKASFLPLLWLLLLVLATTIQPVTAQEESTDDVICVLNELQFSDYGGGVVKAGGEIVNDQAKTTGEGVIDPTQYWDGLSDLLVENAVETTVTLLVVDDFTTEAKTPSKTLQSHGEYVHSVARHAASRGLINPIRVDISTDASGNLIEEPTLDTIINKLNVEIDNMQTDYAVVNMSWFIIPCSFSTQITLEDREPFVIEINVNSFQDAISNDEVSSNLVQYTYDVNELQNLNLDYSQDIVFEALATAITIQISLLDNPNLDRDEIMFIIEGQDESVEATITILSEQREPASSDQLNDFKAIFDNEQVLGIGAAGNMNCLAGALTSTPICGSIAEDIDQFDKNANQTLDAFIPASFDNVLAISGLTVQGGDWTYSQDGQVAAPAAWHYFPDTGDFGSGTSFATPMMSGIIAVLAQQGCPVEDLRQIGKGTNVPYIAALAQVCNP